MPIHIGSSARINSNSAAARFDSLVASVVFVRLHQWHGSIKGCWNVQGDPSQQEQHPTGPNRLRHHQKLTGFPFFFNQRMAVMEPWDDPQDLHGLDPESTIHRTPHPPFQRRSFAAARHRPWNPRSRPNEVDHHLEPLQHCAKSNHDELIHHQAGCYQCLSIHI